MNEVLNQEDRQVFWAKATAILRLNGIIGYGERLSIQYLINSVSSTFGEAARNNWSGAIGGLRLKLNNWTVSKITYYFFPNIFYLVINMKFKFVAWKLRVKGHTIFSTDPPSLKNLDANSKLPTAPLQVLRVAGQAVKPAELIRYCIESLWSSRMRPNDLKMAVACLVRDITQQISRSP